MKDQRAAETQEDVEEGEEAAETKSNPRDTTKQGARRDALSDAFLPCGAEQRASPREDEGERRECYADQSSHISFMPQR